MTRTEELIQRGLEAESKERADLIDNMYRAGCLRSFSDVPYTTEELRKIYRDRLDRLGYQ